MDWFRISYKNYLPFRAQKLRTTIFNPLTAVAVLENHYLFAVTVFTNKSVFLHKTSLLQKTSILVHSS